ncbi:MAG TPA: hypothetical protein VGD92_12310 [Sphingobacteriaceae bacterium]
MSEDPFAEKLFEMKLAEIYRSHPWLADEFTEQEFVALFPVSYNKQRRPVELVKPNRDFYREIYLEVLVAFKQSFG